MTTVAKLGGKYSETDIDDEIVVMRLDNGEFFSLAGTGAVIWRLIDGTRDRAALINALASQFEGDELQISTDVDDFLNQLREMGLIAVG
jgi:hypothetical protein